MVFNWRHRTVDGGDHRSFYNIINNYFKPGPATPKNDPVGYRILKPESRRSKTSPNDYGKAYVAGNIVEGNDRVTADNWDGGVQIEGPPELDVAKTLELRPCARSRIRTRMSKFSLRRKRMRRCSPASAPPSPAAIRWTSA